MNIVDNKTNTKSQTKIINKEREKNQISGNMCQVSRITCHMSVRPTSASRDPPPANSQTMHSRRVYKDLKSTFLRG